jgi:hypothetical protein
LDKRKKSRTPAPKKKPSAANSLERRVQRLEMDMHDMRAKMNDFGEDLSALRVSVRHVDERTLRNEKVMLEVQGEMRQGFRLVAALADKFQVVAPPPHPKLAEPLEEDPELGDDEFDAPED